MASTTSSAEARPYSRAAELGASADWQLQVSAINALLLAHLRSQAAVQAADATPLVRELRDLWSALDDAALQRAAAAPCVLLDARLANGEFWQQQLRLCVREPRLPVTDGERGDGVERRLLRLVLGLAWHLARAQPLTARIALGMSAATGAALRQLPLSAIEDLAALRPAWARPRWQEEPRIWGDLLSAAIDGDRAREEVMRVSVLQLIARELQQAAEREARQL
ncbi:MAG: hypothetical protein NZM12_13595 [Steroidobacteraceae bacterium]|nr:hypothetical protein [Steroidobacteraceae bacterium]MDW8258579.1 hypothetical protein [Gammaproteobacteria bacterium]